MKELLERTSYNILRSGREYSTATVIFCNECGHEHRDEACDCGCNDYQAHLFVSINNEGEPGSERDQRALVDVALSSFNSCVARRRFLGYPDNAKLSRAR